jgi:hypothetical protein
VLQTNTVIPTGAGRRLFFAFAPANASACAVEESLFDFKFADEFRRESQLDFKFQEKLFAHEKNFSAISSAMHKTNFSLH